MFGLEIPPKRTLRVWHIAETYPPNYGGGAAVYVKDVCQFLASRGHEIRVLCTEDADRPPYTIRTEWDGAVRVSRLNLPYFKRQAPGGWMMGLFRWLRHRKKVFRLAGDLLNDWAPDLVQYHTPHPVDEEFLLAIQNRGFPIVGMSHCAWTICPRLNLLQSPLSTACSGPSATKCLMCLYSHYDGSTVRALAKLPWRIVKLGVYPLYRLWRRTQLRRRVRGLAAVSEFMTAVHESHVGGTVHFVPLGIDLTGFPAEQPKRPRNPLRFGFMAGFQSHKGVWDILDAAASLKREGLAFELHIWGVGQEDRQQDLIRRDLVERVFLHGKFDPAQRWTVFSKVDVLLMATTVSEAYGRVIQEAAAMGVPSVAPANGGVLEQIRDGVDGLLYTFRDRTDLERQMRRMLTEVGLRDQLAANLRPVLDTRAGIVALERFYFDVLGISVEQMAIPSGA